MGFDRRSPGLLPAFCPPDTRLTLLGRPVPLLVSPSSPKTERSLAKKPFFSGLRVVLPLRGRPLLLRLFPPERRRPPPREEFEREGLRLFDDVWVMLTSL